MSETDSASKTEGAMSFMSHLIELRDRLLRIVLAVLGIFVCLFYWANDIYTYLAEPLTRHMPEGSQMIAIDVASPFLTPFKLVLMLSVFLAMPYILFQIWGFVAPGLYTHEKRLAGPLLASSVILFYCGMAFAYYVVFPLVFGFFSSVGPEIVSISTDIGRYLDFVLSLFFGFGIAFEVPIATIILVAMGMTTPKKLSEKRPFVIVGAFVIGMLLTPPDVISQVLLAFPMWLLFEAGLFASSRIFAERLKRDELEEEQRAAEEAVAGAGVGAGFVDGYDVVDDPAETGVDSDYQPLSDEEMDAELDSMDDDDDEDDTDYDDPLGDGYAEEESVDEPTEEPSEDASSSEDSETAEPKPKPNPYPDDLGP
jgi:sec-independent protein translocase protein TatC